MLEERYSVGDRDNRPWGNWEVMAVGPGYAIKRIEVLSGEMLSLQSHNHRSEHWIVLAGHAEVTLEERRIHLTTNGQVFIPPKAKHRVQNVGAGLLSFIEVQTGEHLDENDIVRFEDGYGRV